MVKGELLKGIAILIGLILGLFATVVLSVLFNSIALGIVLSVCLLALYLWNVCDGWGGGKYHGA
jgi:hypothetical protein